MDHAAVRAPTRVLTNRALLRHVMDFVDGVPVAVVALVDEHKRNRSTLPWSACGVLPLQAIKHGDLRLLRGLRRLSATRRYQLRAELAFDGATRCAVQFGRLEILHWLADTGMLFDGDVSGTTVLSTSNSKASTLLGWAVRYSSALSSVSKLEIVTWVCQRFPAAELQDVNAEDLSYARVSVLAFLLHRGVASNGFAGPRVVDASAAMGKLDTVRFLLEQGAEGPAKCTTNAMDGAAAAGFLDVVHFLHHHRTEGCTTKAMDGAARGGHVDLLQFLHSHRQEGCTPNAMDDAALLGCLPVVRFLHTHRREGCTTRAVDGAAWRGHVEVVRFLMTQRMEGCTSHAMDTAAQHGHLSIVRFLHDHGVATCTTNAMDGAASGGHLELLKFLHVHRPEGCTRDAMTQAAVNGHADVLLFLATSRHEGVHAYALERTAARGHVACVDVLCRWSTRGCLLAARHAALDAGHPQVVVELDKWLDPDIPTCSVADHVRPDVRPCQKAKQRVQDAAWRPEAALAGHDTGNQASSSLWRLIERWWWFRSL